MRPHLHGIAVLCLFIVYGGTSANAFVEENMSLHGFVSQGYLKSTDNNYLGRSEKGSFEFNEIGINIYAPLTDDLSFGIQFFSRDMGDFGNNDMNIDYAALNYNWRDWLAFHAGKIKLPFGLYNRKRNADMLRTSIVFPQSVYPEGFREFVVGLYGAGIHGVARIGSLGYLDYELFGGTVNLSGNSQYLQELLNRYKDRLEITDYELPEMGLAIDHVEGGMIIWNPPVAGLRLGGTCMRGSGEILMDPISVNFDIKGINTISLEYDFKNFTFASEYMQIKIVTEIPVLPDVTTRLEGWYGEIAWQAVEWFALGAAYGEYYPDAKDKDGSAFEDKDYPDFFGWQKDITISTKFNMNEYWCIKLETHFISGLGLANLDANPSQDAEEEWMLFAAKVSLNF